MTIITYIDNVQIVAAVWLDLNAELLRNENPTVSLKSRLENFIFILKKHSQ